MDWKLKRDVEPMYTWGGFWYDLNWGYLRLADFLDDPGQIAEALEARELLRSLELELMDAGLFLRDPDSVKD